MEIPALIHSKEQAVEAVRRNAYCLARVGEALKDDADVVLQAVRCNGMALEFASPRLRADKVIVLAAVSQDAFALHHADISMRDDKEVILAAAKNNFIVYTLASRKVRADHDFMVHLFRNEVRDQIMCGFMQQEVPALMAEAMQKRESQKLASLQELHELERH